MTPPSSSRRHFLRTLGLGALAAPLLASGLLKGSPVPSAPVGGAGSPAPRAGNGHGFKVGDWVVLREEVKPSDQALGFKPYRVLGLTECTTRTRPEWHMCLDVDAPGWVWLPEHFRHATTEEVLSYYDALTQRLAS